MLLISPKMDAFAYIRRPMASAPKITGFAPYFAPISAQTSEKGHGINLRLKKRARTILRIKPHISNIKASHSYAQRQYTYLTMQHPSHRTCQLFPRFLVNPCTNSSTSLCSLSNSKLSSESCNSIRGFSSGALERRGDSERSVLRRVGSSVLRREVGVGGSLG